jgi:hypothetical protein
VGVPTRVAHARAYCSKCNPIERRLYRHVPRACQGVLCAALHTGRGLSQKIQTPQGRAGTVRVWATLYAGGRAVTEAFKKTRPIVFAKLLPQWHSWARPQ